MEKTPKYEFGKPDQNDFYDVDVFNNNMEKVETAMTEFDDTGTVAEIKSFPEMLTKLVTGNKLAVTLRNLKAGLQFVLHAGSIVNNCVTDNPNLPLSAAQGKALMDLYNVLNTKGTVYEKYNVVDAIKGDLVPITTVELPAGNYIIFASNNVNNEQVGTISCALKASSGKLSSMEMRGISNNGGGLLACAYFTTTTKSTVTSFGHGYNSGDYKYQSLLIAVKL